MTLEPVRMSKFDAFQSAAAQLLTELLKWVSAAIGLVLMTSTDLYESGSNFWWFGTVVMVLLWAVVVIQALALWSVHRAMQRGQWQAPRHTFYTYTSIARLMLSCVWLLFWGHWILAVAWTLTGGFSIAFHSMSNDAAHVDRAYWRRAEDQAV